MSRNSRSQLSSEAARRRLEAVDLEEKSKLAEGLALIALVDQRRDYLEAGYASMHAYCTGKLGWSDDRASKRIQAARLAQRLPVVLEHVADGRLSVSALIVLAPHLTPDNADELTTAAAHRSRNEISVLLADRARRDALARSMSRGDAPIEGEGDAPAIGQVPLLADLAGPPPGGAGADQHAPGHVDRPIRRGHVAMNADGTFDLRLTLTADEHAAFQHAQDLLAHVVRDGDPAVVVGKALAALVERLEKQRFGAGAASTQPKHAPRGRHIPLALRRHVAERDGHCCSFTSADGHRCGETRGLQFDHVVPVAEGGATNAENLRLLCAAHNRFEAERLLGAEHVAAMRERRERAVAHAAAAMQREEWRRAEREAEAAALSPTQDTITALLALGFKASDARDAARLTESAIEEPLGERVKRAIQLLSGPILDRSARWAKATR